MTAVVESISPGRGRAADVVTISGSGFSTTPARNVVTFAGVPAGVNLGGQDAIEVVVPVGIPVDQHVEVLVENLDAPGLATWSWWSQDSVLATGSMLLRTKIPWKDEKLRGLGRDVKDMTTAEARFFERLASKIELVPDMLASKGNLFAATSSGVAQVLAGTAGQPFVSGGADPGQFRTRQCQTLQWGLYMEDTDLSKLMDAGGPESGSNELQPDCVVLDSGKIALVSMRERQSISSRVIEIELFVNGSSVLDLKNGDPDFPGPGIRNGQSLTFYPWISVTQGDLVRVKIVRNNTTTDCAVLAYALVA